MNRTKTLAVLALLAVASLPAVSAAASIDVTITGVDVSPSEPVPGDEVAIEPTIENFDSSSAGYFVDRVRVVEAGGGNDPDEYADVKDLGTIPVGGTKTVPLSTTFEEPGTYDLRVRVSGRETANDQRTQLSYPLTITVEDRTPQVDVNANDSAAGIRTDGSVTVANSLGSPIENVELTVDGEDVAITNRRAVLATVEPNASRTVEFDYRADEPGTHRMTATLTYTTSGGVTDTVTDTVTVRTTEERPQLDIDTNTSTAGIESDGTVTVANGIGAAMTNAELTVSGEGVTVRNDRTVFTRVADGESATANFDFRPAEAGEQELTATLRYSTRGGATRTVTETLPIEVEPLRDRVALDLSSVEGGNSQAVKVTVLNQGNAPLSNVSVRGTSPNATVGQALLDRVAPGESRTVRLNASMSENSATVDVESTYDVGEQRGRAAGSTALTHTPGTIGLTGLEVVPEGNRLRISGSASNLGTTDAESVRVVVVDTERVTPTSPNREFFVGTVPASDFVSFDVYATVQGNVSTVPLDVEYLVDGEQHTRTVEVDAAGASRALATGPEPDTSGSGGGGFLLPAVVGLFVAAGVAVLIVRAWRNSRGGD
ncbi:COG1361 S-layer family protein [Halosimplex sp. TS25]|uniref:COG1361 S-layer family protein n=1 Tax=Halosimplex rarum TaxID=3396619 RepID=UPI0039EAB723